MLKWFSDPSYKTDKLQLAHGIRMLGGKTKNPEVFSTVYKGHDRKYDFEDFAEIAGVELHFEDEIEIIKIYVTGPLSSVFNDFDISALRPKCTRKSIGIHCL